MACTGAIADHDDYFNLFCLSDLSVAAEAAVDQALVLVTGEIYATLAAQGMCDCTWTDWATNYLKHLNIVNLLLHRDCPCGRVRVTELERDNMRAWFDEQMRMLREGYLTICTSDTGRDYPYATWAQPAWTDWIIADVVLGRL